MGIGKFAGGQFQPQCLAGVFDDAARCDAVGNQRHAAQLDDGQPDKGQRVGDAENHGFVQVVAVVFEQRGHYAAFAVGGMLVWEFGHGGKFIMDYHYFHQAYLKIAGKALLVKKLF